ncbi:altronate oxidoreductase [Sporosarcina newyorkensis 2681]|uniref:Altronate oxidoreductase n=1 Tax=Sporosarcina newyorkensis 2681 TaxID=1027292 RepID=F9DRR8_9BACL|nr:tagaturonate reductase [Sporosarcina newyorkensis]EGQ26471.1 altronate oxidoreductase [Sporosarcina newyorkensis 2681]
MVNEIPTLGLSNIEKQALYEAPERVLQIGDGNFIRGFVDWMVDELNYKTGFDGKIVSVQATPRGNRVPVLNEQDGLFTLLVRGIKEGERIEKAQLIQSIQRAVNPYTDWQELLKIAESPEMEFLISNTTEAGLRYKKESYSPDKSPVSFPGKVVALLYHRYVYFKGNMSKGWILIPCELIEQNGEALKNICLKIIKDWELPNDFAQWMLDACTFCNTLVDRIVPGYPADEAEQLWKNFGYTDRLLTVAEPYHLFVIEGPDFLEKKLPFKEAGLNVQFDYIAQFRENKIKLLNAPHTIMAAIGILKGIHSVREAMDDELLYSFIKDTLLKEICTTLPTNEEERAYAYIEEVFDRFRNPYLHHRLTDISLNSFSKFSARVWPSLDSYRKKTGKNPRCLVFSFAALLVFFEGVVKDNGYAVKDDARIVGNFEKFYRDYKGTKEELVQFIKELICEEYKQTLEELGDLPEEIADDYISIQRTGIQLALQRVESQVTYESN